MSELTTNVHGLDVQVFIAGQIEIASEASQDTFITVARTTEGDRVLLLKTNADDSLIAYEMEPGDWEFSPEFEAEWLEDYEFEGDTLEQVITMASDKIPFVPHDAILESIDDAARSAADKRGREVIESGFETVVKALWYSRGHRGQNAIQALKETIASWTGDENGASADALIDQWESEFLASVE